jgi:hypothetical protein
MADASDSKWLMLESSTEDLRISYALNNGEVLRGKCFLGFAAPLFELHRRLTLHFGGTYPLSVVY